MTAYIWCYWASYEKKYLWTKLQYTWGMQTKGFGQHEVIKYYALWSCSGIYLIRSWHSDELERVIWWLFHMNFKFVFLHKRSWHPLNSLEIITTNSTLITNHSITVSSATVKISQHSGAQNRTSQKLALCESRTAYRYYAKDFHPRQLAKAGAQLNWYEIVVLKEHALYHSCLTLPKAFPSDYSHYPLHNNLKKHAHKPQTSNHVS